MSKLLKLELLGGGGSRSRYMPYCKEVITLGRDGFPVTHEMKHNRDYSESNSVGSRGVYDYYILRPGHVYEILEGLSWTRSRKYYLFITDDGEETEMTYEEMIECLSGGSIKTS